MPSTVSTSKCSFTRSEPCHASSSMHRNHSGLLTTKNLWCGPCPSPPLASSCLDRPTSDPEPKCVKRPNHANYGLEQHASISGAGAVYPGRGTLPLTALGVPELLSCCTDPDPAFQTRQMSNPSLNSAFVDLIPQNGRPAWAKPSPSCLRQHTR